jgi:hypothetical protein
LPSVLQQVPGSAVTPAGIGTTAITTQEGSWLACLLGWNTVTPGQYIPAPAVNVTDSAGNLWQQAAISPPGYASSVRAAVWVAPNALPVSWVSAGLTAFAASLGYTVAEITGMPQAADLDFSVSDTTPSGSAPSLTWIASENGIGLAAVVAGYAAETATVPGGWSSLGTATAGASTSGCAVFGYLNGTITAGTATTSLALGTATAYSYALCSLSASASPPPQPNLNFPMVTVEAAFGAQPGDISASTDFLFSSEYIGWTDITTRAIGPAIQGRIKAKRGRPYQLQQQETGTCEVPLSNVDGAFTPTAPGSPYYSNAINQNMSFQASLAPWTPQHGAVLAQSPAQTFASGLNATAAYSVQVTCGTAATPGLTSELIAINPNYPYTPSAWLYAGTAPSAGAEVVVNWYTAAQAYISTTSAGAGTLPAGQWTQFSIPGGTAPAGAAYARVIPQLAGTPGNGFQFYAAEAALAPGPEPVQTGLVAPLTPIRVAAWWQGRRYALWGGYAQAWPQEWPDMPQWGFSPLKALDALGAAAAGQMQSALIGEVLADNGATPADPFIFSGGYLQPADANGLPAVNRASGNQITGTYLDGNAQQVSTGLAMNFLGDSGTGMGATGYSGQDTGHRGPSMLYADTGLTEVLSSFCSAEFWFNWSGTAQQASLFTLYGQQSAFFSGGAGYGAFLAVTAGGSTLTTAGPGFGTITAALTPSQSPQHYALVVGAGSVPSFGALGVYLNGALAGQSETPVTLSPVVAAVLGPGRYSYDTGNDAARYYGYNYAAGHLAVYDYTLSPSRVAAHYEAGAAGWQGVSASQRFSQILTWAQLGLKRGGWSQQSVTGQAEITQIGPAYDLSGQQATDGIYAVAQSEGGRYGTQANGSLIYEERNEGYNQGVSAVLADGTAAAPVVLNTDPGFATGLAGWTGGGVSWSTAYSYGGIGGLSASGTVTSPAFSYNGGSAAAGFWVQAGNGGTVTCTAVTSAGTATRSTAVSPGAWSFLPLAVPAVSGVSSASLGISAGTAPFYLAWAGMWYSPGQVPYSPKQSYGFDTTYIYNEVTATQQDGPNQLILYDARGTASQAQYFRRSALSFTPNVVSPYDVSDITTWSLAEYQDPSLHVSAITIDPASNPLGAFPVILPLDQGQVAETNRSPVGGAPITETGTVEQVSHVIGPGYWKASYQLSPYGPAQSVLSADTPGLDEPALTILGW